MMSRKAWLAVLLASRVIACSDSNNHSGSEPQCCAEIGRTDYGIPHIKAEDWGSLGYGYGYAYAQDNFCVTMRESVIASGRSAELMGEAEGDIERDLFFRYLNGTEEEFRSNFVEALPATDMLERSDFTITHQVLQAVPHAQWTPAVVPAAHERREGRAGQQACGDEEPVHGLNWPARQRDR